MFLWRRYRPERFKLIPGALLGITAATVIAQFLHLRLNYVQVPGNLMEVIHMPSLTTLHHIDGGIFGSALAIAFIASAETLLSASAVDKMQNLVRTNYDKELMAQGIGNMLCGFVGAIPMTGVIVRSSANVQAGATSRLSAILHGVWILAVIALFPGVLRMVPICSLAGVLVFTGFNLIKIRDIRHLASFGRIPVFIYAATLITIISTDLLTGVLVGVILSVCKLLYKATHLNVYTEADLLTAAHMDLHLRGSATFLGIPFITAVLEKIPDGSIVHLRTEQLHYIDHSCLDLMQDWIKNSPAHDLHIVFEQDSLERKYRPALHTA